MNTDEGLRDRDEEAPPDGAGPTPDAEAARGHAGGDDTEDDSDGDDTEDDTDGDDAGDPQDGDGGPGWWRRDHPTFTALSGFFTGLVVIIVVPGGFAALLRVFFDYDTAEDLFPLVLVILAVPIGLIAATRTRRFGQYMLLGMLATAAVVVGVGALVVWILVMRDG